MSKLKDSTLNIDVLVTDTEDFNSDSEDPVSLSKHKGNLLEMTIIGGKFEEIFIYVYLKMKDLFPL